MLSVRKTPGLPACSRLHRGRRSQRRQSNPSARSTSSRGRSRRRAGPAQGQLLSINQNAALLSILGTTYGGDGVSTFALPEFAGLAPGSSNYVICLQGAYPAR